MGNGESSWCQVPTPMSWHLEECNESSKIGAYRTYFHSAYVLGHKYTCCWQWCWCLRSACMQITCGSIICILGLATVTCTNFGTEQGVDSEMTGESCGLGPRDRVQSSMAWNSGLKLKLCSCRTRTTCSYIQPTKSACWHPKAVYQ